MHYDLVATSMWYRIQHSTLSWCGGSSLSFDKGREDEDTCEKRRARQTSGFWERNERKALITKRLPRLSADILHLRGRFVVSFISHDHESQFMTLRESSLAQSQNLQEVTIYQCVRQRTFSVQDVLRRKKKKEERGERRRKWTRKFPPRTDSSVSWTDPLFSSRVYDTTSKNHSISECNGPYWEW